MHAISRSVNIPVCISIEDTQVANQEDTDMQKLKMYVIQGYLHEKISRMQCQALLTNKKWAGNGQSIAMKGRIRRLSVVKTNT